MVISMNFRIRLFLIFLVFLNVFSAAAQNSNYKFMHLDISEGLSHNQVRSILKDSRGFMWFGTMLGLNRFDGYDFKVFTHNPDDSKSLSDNYIQYLAEDKAGRIWAFTRNGPSVFDPQTETFCTGAELFRKSKPGNDYHINMIFGDKSKDIWFVDQDKGLCKYLVEKDSIIEISHDQADSTTPVSNEISGLAEDDEGNYWLINYNGIIEKLDGKKNKIIFRTGKLVNLLRSNHQNFNLFLDADNDLWIYSQSDDQGLFYYNPVSGKIAHITRNSGKSRLDNDIVTSMAQDMSGLIWIGTDHGGINLLDKKDFSISYLLHNEEDERSLSQNSITCLYKDNNGIIWAGTFKNGINYYHEGLLKFRLYKHQPSNPNSLGYNDVNCFNEDEKGNLWIGTNGGGLEYFDRAGNIFHHYHHHNNDPASLSNDVIVSLLEDHEGKLWIGTFYGGLDYFDGKRFYHYKNDPNNSTSISDNRVWKIFEDSENNLWIGTLGGGLDRFDRQKQVFYHYEPGDVNSVNSGFILDITEDKSGNLWFGTAFGINVLDKKTGSFRYYLHSQDDTASLSNNNINVITIDSKGNIWIGTSDGLDLYNPGNNNFRVFRQKDGLPDNVILTILEDNSGNLWMSTTKGLSNLIISKDKNTNKLRYRFRNYDKSDGLQGKEFNVNSACKTHRGELIFGGSNGFNIFRPDEIKSDTIRPDVVLTNFQLFNKDIKINEKIDGRVLLKKSFSSTREITLKHNENMFSIGFAALNYFHPEKNKYKYRLEGFNNKWLTTDGHQRRVTYTNLDPGEYTFRVKASNSDGLWNEKGTSLNIKVLPPLWRTSAAFVIYIIMLIGALLLLRHLVLERERLKFRTEQERQTAIRNHEMDMMKIKFFTNISHEFRTPISLILSPLDKILQRTSDPEQQKLLLLVQRNSRRLLNLVNQLLDFRRMDVQELRLNLSPGNVIEFIREIVISFSDLSEKKEIQYSFHTSIDQLQIQFDHDKLEKILFNLLSNAFKFTQDKGKISVNIGVKESDKEIRNSLTKSNKSDWLEIKVIDSGIGIPVSKHKKIFERFFQSESPGTFVNNGSGIGLSLTYEFVKLHGGSIEVDSEPGKGSCFTVLLPVDHTTQKPSHDKIITEIIVPQTAETIASDSIKGVGRGYKNKPVILLIEDNEDFRFYLKDNLKYKYIVKEAVNGQDGWDQIMKHIPDLVISDIKMPVMDGIEMCQKVKADKRTLNIPIILLTARASDQQKLEGLNIGADEYITKPFNFEILESRIKYLINKREQIKKSKNHIEIRPDDISITSMDEKFIKKALEIVEKNISNTEFSVEELSRELAVSRVHLYKKLVALTGKTPIEFIRTMRMKRAAQLLEKSQLNVSEVAYRVGFNDPKYFTKYFKAEFNVLPSRYIPAKTDNDKIVDE